MSELRAAQQRIRELEQAVGQKTMEVEILQAARDEVLPEHAPSRELRGPLPRISLSRTRRRVTTGALLLACSSAPLSAQSPLRLIGGAGVGPGWTGAHLGIEAVDRYGRGLYAADLVFGDGDWIAVATAASRLTRDSGPTPFIGAGGGLAVGSDWGSPTLVVRVGVDFPLTSAGAAIRVEGRSYFVYGGGAPFIMVALGVP